MLGLVNLVIKVQVLFIFLLAILGLRAMTSHLATVHRHLIHLGQHLAKNVDFSSHVMPLFLKLEIQDLQHTSLPHAGLMG